MGAALHAAAMQACTLSDRGSRLSYGSKAGMRIVLEGDPLRQAAIGSTAIAGQTPFDPEIAPKP